MGSNQRKKEVTSVLGQRGLNQTFHGHLVTTLGFDEICHQTKITTRGREREREARMKPSEPFHPSLLRWPGMNSRGEKRAAGQTLQKLCHVCLPPGLQERCMQELLQSVPIRTLVQTLTDLCPDCEFFLGEASRDRWRWRWWLLLDDRLLLLEWLWWLVLRGMLLERYSARCRSVIHRVRGLHRRCGRAVVHSCLLLLLLLWLWLRML